MSCAAPKILLLDEPTVGVDPQSRERIYTMIDSLSAEGCSVLLTTHHMEEAEVQSVSDWSSWTEGKLWQTEKLMC